MSRHSKKRRNKWSKSPSNSENSVFENGKDVQEEESGANFEIKTSKVMGRYMVSTRKLKPGDVILSEDPLVVGPCSGGKVQCLGCYRVLEDSPYRKCKGCNWLLCSDTCEGLYKKHGHSKEECLTLKTCQSSKNFDLKDLDQMRCYYDCIVPLRCLLLKKFDYQAYQQLMNMETHNEIRRNIPDLWKCNEERVVNKIIDDWNLKEFSQDEIHSICGILEVNSFEIGQQGVNIRGLYPTAFLMSHDCIPNTNHTDEEKSFKLTVRASTCLEIGQPITLSYAYTLQGTLKRREHLLENKFFECQCRRCKDPEELGTFTSALRCPKCQTGCVLSINPLDLDSDWACNNQNKKCVGYKISARSMQLLLDRVSKELEDIDCNDIASMENFLQKYRNVLHPSHYLCLSVKLSLSQLYGKITGFLIYELDEEMLLRKLSVCEEIMKIFDVIEPGYTRLRGVTLYEMHAPLMILLTREFESQNVSKGELRCRLRRVVKCLEEASVILSHESESSSEGMMGVAAQDALVRIRDWEKILGKI